MKSKGMKQNGADHDFYYRVCWSVSDLQGKNYNHEEEFLPVPDLLSARKRAFEYYSRRMEYIKEQRTFFDDKQISSPFDFELGENLAWTVTIEFYSTVDGIEESFMIVEGSIENSNEEIEDNRILEAIMFDEFGLPEPMW